ncbi:MAG: type I methionyl aminopeptidase [Bacteroidia bacterium]|nr:type I methionyl aminopeptidase [Bacteroidia bacterium]
MGEKISYKTPEEIEMIRQSSLLVSKTLGEVKKHIRPGANTMDLDKIAETFIRDHGGVPAFKNYKPRFADSAYPYTLCTSVNDEVIHGMPSARRILQEGDIISVDCGVLLNGWFGDSAYTFPVGEVSAKKQKLLQVTRESLFKGIEKAVAGNRLGEVSFAIQRHAETYGFSVVRELVGHGIGRKLHEPPDVPNYGRKGAGVRLTEGMVLAIEPMINLGKRFVEVSKDGYTIYTTDRQPSAHFEHSVAVGKDKAVILSNFELIEH